MHKIYILLHIFVILQENAVICSKVVIRKISVKIQQKALRVVAF